MAHAFILVAEDDDLTREFLVNVLNREGYKVAQAATGTQALEQLRSLQFDLVLSDIQMGGASGMDVLSHLSRTSPDTPVILITGFAQPDAAMDAIAQGAADYLSKPIDVFALRAAVARALERQRLRRDHLALNLALRSQTLGEKRLVGTSPAMVEVYKQIAQLAPTEATILLTGESGSGKELVARAFHERSRHAEGPYVALNCASLAESVLESELFGHEKGAFTDANRRRPGVFEQAHKGSLFLDEIGDVPLKMQVQLLRVLQEGEVRPVGGGAFLKVEVRVMAATNRDLASLVSAGRIRSDLYHRLNVAAVRVPPLRERGDDIVELARYFVGRHALAFGRVVPEIAEETLLCLKSYAWPGNVRELENALAHAVAMSQRAVLLPDDLPAEVRRRGTQAPSAGIHTDWPTLEMLQNRYIGAVIGRARGNKSLIAKVLGMNRRTIQRLLGRSEQGKK